MDSPPFKPFRFKLVKERFYKCIVIHFLYTIHALRDAVMFESFSVSVSKIFDATVRVKDEVLMVPTVPSRSL
jgi:hypothetical protein